MITGMVFLYVNVCLYLNVNFVILYMLLYKGPRGRQQLLSWSLNFVIKIHVHISSTQCELELQYSFNCLLFQANTVKSILQFAGI